MKSMHKIRKTYASCLIDEGVPESVITSQMGHTSIETTKKFYYYNHHDEEEMENMLSEVKVLQPRTQYTLKNTQVRIRINRINKGFS